jgi:hypothetical protein
MVSAAVCQPLAASPPKKLPREYQVELETQQFLEPLQRIA